MKGKKIVVLNNSGNVGKTTLCCLLLQPRIENSKIISLETINSDKNEDLNIPARDFINVYKKMAAYESPIIDVGSSNMADFCLQIPVHHEFIDETDFFIIPVVPTHKQQKDSLSTIERLIDNKVPAAKIRVILNRLSRYASKEAEFDVFLNSQRWKSLMITDYPVINESEVFLHLSRIDKTFMDVLTDPRDLKTAMYEETDPELRGELAELRAIKSMVTAFNDSLDIAFKNLQLEDKQNG